MARQNDRLLGFHVNYSYHLLSNVDVDIRRANCTHALRRQESSRRKEVVIPLLIRFLPALDLGLPSLVPAYRAKAHIRITLVLKFTIKTHDTSKVAE